MIKIVIEKSIKPLIIDIISSVNFKRNNYNLPITHKIDITSSWLLGLKVCLRVAIFL